MENTTENQTTKTPRELLAEMLGNVHPEKDFTDDTTFFTQIFDDYEEYAKVLEATAPDAEALAEAERRGRASAIAEMEAKAAEEAEKQAEAERQAEAARAGDGVPLLGGANNSAGYRRHRSIFDIAAEA